MKRTTENKFSMILMSIFLMMAYSSTALGKAKGSFLYTLSNFTGPIPCNWVGIAIDKERNEIYVTDTSESSVKIFDKNGMEVYTFGDDGSLGGIYDVAVEKDGDILVLSYMVTIKEQKYYIVRCNYRGEEISKIEIQNLPPAFSDFRPNRIFYREGHLYWADKNLMKVVVTDKSGLFEDGYDIASLLRFDEKKRADTGIRGLSVDREGNIFFTIPVLFTAYKLSPDRKIVAFGQRGSAPGKFNIVGGIVSDDKGYLYLTDTLRCVVMIFDKDFNFLTEFGYRGFDPGNLIAPIDLAVDKENRVYVTQSRRRGVSVFKVDYN